MKSDLCLRAYYSADCAVFKQENVKVCQSRHLIRKRVFSDISNALATGTAHLLVLQKLSL